MFIIIMRPRNISPRSIRRARSVLRFRTWNLEKTGTATATLSISSPGLWFSDPAVTRKMARNCNDYAARIVKNDSKLFGAFAAMSLPE